MTDTEVEHLNIVRGSIQYLDAKITLDIDPTGTVAIAITHNGDTKTWLPAGYTGASTPGVDDQGNDTWTRKARTSDPIDFSDPTYDDHSDYLVYVQPTDTPEAPILPAGSITLT